MTVRYHDKLLSMGVAMATVLSCGALNTARAAETSGATAGMLEEVVVTARRREETVQTVPVSIGVISGEQLQQRGFETNESFNRMMPNLVIHGSNGFFGRQEGSFQQRGIGNVQIYYDGIAHAETFGIPLGNILEVDRVEVLRGPQGTLFGKETMGGAIQYVTKKPSDTFGARVKLSTGSYNRMDVTGIVDLPLSDTLLTKLSLAKLSRGGYLQSTTAPGQVYGSQEDTLADLDILWKPTDKFSWRFDLSYQDDKNNGNPITDWAINTSSNCKITNPTNAEPLNVNPDLTCLYNQLTSGGKQLFPIPQEWAYGANEQYKTASNYVGPDLYTDIKGFASQLNYQLTDTWAIKGLGSYRTVKNFDYTDFDATPYHIFDGKNYNEQDEGTAEAQLLFTGKKLTGTNGLYAYTDYRRAHRLNWFQNELRIGVNPVANAAARAYLAANGFNVISVAAEPVGTAPGAPGNGPVPGNNNVDQLTYNYSKGWAVFTEWSYKATDKLSATLGVRYNEDKVTVTQYRPKDALPLLCCEPVPSIETDGTGPLFTTASGISVQNVAKAKFTNTAPKASLQYQWTPDVMTYYAYGEGFNRGGAGLNNLQNGQAPQLVTFQPEKLKNHEVGLRSDLFDRRLRFNASIFYMLYNNVQVATDVNRINITTNGGKAISKGAEVEGLWAATDAFHVNYAFGYNDAHFTEVPPLGPTGIRFTKILVGQTLAYAPKRSASIGLSYDIMLAEGAGVTLRDDYGWQSEQLSTNDYTNSVLIPSYGLMNARITYHAAGGKWDAELSGSNVLGQYYRINGYRIPNLFNNVGTPGRPREWGLTFNFRF